MEDRLRFLGCGLPIFLRFTARNTGQAWWIQDITRVYVSTGVGTSGIPVRFFARPEIVVFELVKEK